MEFRHTLEVLHANAKEVGELMDRLEKNKDVSAIELDLLLQKLRGIYDLVIDLQNAITDQDKPVQKEIQKPASSDTALTGQVDDIVPDQKQPERKTMVREQIEHDLKKEEEQNAAQLKREPYVSDRFKTTKPSINEELAARAKSKEISSSSKSKPLSGITNALGLNEKFELIKELFGGDKARFEQTMQELNVAGSFVEAYNYLNTTFNWDMDSPYVQRLLELIRRKLIVKRDEQ